MEVIYITTNRAGSGIILEVAGKKENKNHW